MTTPSDRSDEIVRAWRRERPDLDPSSVGVITRVWDLARIFEAERRRVLLDHGIDPAILDLLGTLRRAGAPYALETRELAARTAVTAGAISQRVARAEDAGWVTRRPLPGRHVLVELTESGRAVVDRVAGSIFEHESALLAHLGDRRRRELEAALRDLVVELGDRDRDGRS